VTIVQWRGRSGFSRFGLGWGVGELLFGLVWMGMALAFFALSIYNVVDIVELRSSGVRVTGTSLRTWSETSTSTSTDANGNTTTTTTTNYYTQVRYNDRDGDAFVRTVNGSHKPPSPVALIYRAGDPGSVRSAGEVNNVGLGFAVFFALFTGAFVVFGVGFFTRW
jgi:hypothetical protein